MQKYMDSPYQLLSTVFPEHDWLPWKFGHTPKGYWENMKNQRLFVDWAGNRLNIKEMSDWYKVKQNVRNDWVPW
jgi:hypothetical protein